ncbi:HNH endonuclease [Psychrobacter sp. AOP5-GZ1-6]
MSEHNIVHFDSDLSAHIKVMEELEQESVAQFKFHIRMALERSQHIHRWGDGNFGYIHQLFNEAIEEFRPYNPQQPVTVTSSNDLTPSRKPINPSLRIFVYERDEYRCTNCNSHKDLSIDHKLPVIRGGLNDEDNLHTLCRSCNSSKGTKTMEEWRQAR